MQRGRQTALPIRIRLATGKEVILEARAFQCGTGIRPFTAETLITNPNLLETADCMIVIRAVFSEDPLVRTDEAALLDAEIPEIRCGSLKHDTFFNLNAFGFI